MRNLLIFLPFLSGEENVLSVYVDPRAGSGWFYEGGGANSHMTPQTATQKHSDDDSVFIRNFAGITKPR